jgi:pyrroline-5-carboxylate reductase
MLAEVTQRAAAQNEQYLETMITPAFGAVSRLAAQVGWTDDLAVQHQRLLDAGIRGLVAQGRAPASIRVAEPVDALRDSLVRDFGVQAFPDAREAVEGASTWLLAVKPQVMRAVCGDLAGPANANPLVISIAAGITSAQLDRWLGGGRALVRAMPNTPSLIGEGVTGLFATATVSAAQRDEAATLLRAGGPTTWIDDEVRMDAVTAVSGSGPAYVFLLAEAMQAAAERQGLPGATAALLVRQTIAGAASMLIRSDEQASVLRARVTSPGGTTQAAVEALQAGGFETLLDRAIERATQRGRELSAAND